MLKNGKLLEIVDEERVGTEYESEWEQSGEYGRRAMQCGENLTKLLYYFGISSPLDVVWSHATNSKIKLERALAPGSRVMILEAVCVYITAQLSLTDESVSNLISRTAGVWCHA